MIDPEGRTLDRFSGECFCGAVRYTIRAPLGAARSCHCSRCRKAFSGAGSAYLPVDPARFEWVQGSEHLRTFTSQQHGASIGFCARCGSTLCGLYREQVVGITLGTLDGDPPVRIAEHIFVGSKARWDDIGGDSPMFEEWPPASTESTDRS